MFFPSRSRLGDSCCLGIAAVAILAALGLTRPSAATSHDFQVLGLQPPKEEVEAPDFTLKELKVTFPALLDEDGSVAFMYGVRPLPATYLIGRDGKIPWRAFGAREWDSAASRQYFSRLLSEGKR